VERWRRRNRGLRRRVGGRRAPDDSLEYLIYQTLVGVWPLDEGAEGDRPALAERVRGYVRKAAREAKVRTSWIAPHAAFEAAVDAFVTALFADGEFLGEVAAAARAVAGPGFWNALARTLVHLTAPGVPDVYQGDESWLFALTDPDNRRPVDFASRRAALTALEARPADEALAAELVAAVADGRAKLHIVRTALRLRRALPEVFAGEYAPLRPAGARAEQVFAFARRSDRRTAVTIVPRLVAALGGAPLGAPVWQDTRLPWTGPRRLRNVLTGRTVVLAGDALPVAEALATFPTALLVDEPA
jgi:(1->4)-alpha-D-glucan 1-alpha-D-glucosylmutase